MQNSILTVNGPLNKVFIQINRDIVGIDDGEELHLFDRLSLLRSMRLRIEPKLRDRTATGKYRYRPYSLFSASFIAPSLRSGEPQPIQYVVSLGRRGKAEKLRKTLLAHLAPPIQDASFVSSPPHVPSKMRSFFRFVGTASVVTIGVGIAALAAMTFLALTTEPPIDPDQVRAWGTESMKPYGALGQAELGVLSSAAKDVGMDFTAFEEGPSSDATPFYVFTRLDCEDCATIEHALPSVDRKYSPVMLPTNVTHSEAATLGAIQAYCSEQPAAAWLAMSVTGQIPQSSPTCTDWQSKINTAQLARTLSGLEDEAFPAIVAPNGAVYVGSLEHIPFEKRGKALTEWLDANKGTPKQ